MTTYIVGDQQFRAWSVMTCDGGYGKPPHDHEPHSWDSHIVLYGPYFCPGRTAGKVRTDYAQDGAR